MNILVTGGGTGGHIYPALAFVNYMKKQDPTHQFFYIGAKRGLETEIVPKEGIPFEALEIQGFRRKLSVENLKTIQLFVKSIRRAKKILKEFQPDVVIGTGGYVSGAVVYAAAKMGIPTIIHEQNSVPGVTNKFLSRYVSKIAISLPDAAEYFPENKVTLVGNPRGQEIVDVPKSDILAEFDLDPQKPTVLIFGGSQGALKINEAFVAALPSLAEKEYQILYASGSRYFEQLQKAIDATKMDLTNISVRPYISQMPQVMANVDLLVGRAGATSIAEFTALGLPAILIPSPFVTNDHQTKNAQSLVKAGAVEMIADTELTGERLVEVLDRIMSDKVKLQQMVAASKGQGITDASTRLELLINELI